MNALSDYFERKTRDNGATFYSLTDNAPAWLRDAVMDAHDGEMPNDWRYDIAHSIVSAIDDGALTDDDGTHEIADSLTDVYTHDLMAWLAGDVDRVATVDAACEEMGADDDGIESRVALGQYVAILRMADVILSAWVENADDDVTDDGDPCPACGNAIDYCQGHGEIGDPEGFAILQAEQDNGSDAS